MTTENSNTEIAEKVKKVKHSFIILNIFIIIIALGLSQGYIERCGEFKLKPEFIGMIIIGIFGIIFSGKIEKAALKKQLEKQSIK